MAKAKKNTTGLSEKTLLALSEILEGTCHAVEALVPDEHPIKDAFHSVYDLRLELEEWDFKQEGQRWPKLVYPNLFYAVDFLGNRLGFLIAQGGDINRPLAFVPNVITPFRSSQAEENRAFIAQCDAAHMIVLGLDTIERAEVPVIDLRPYGSTGSSVAMPTFVYSLICWHVNINYEPLKSLGSQTPAPWCRYRVAQLLALDPVFQEGGGRTVDEMMNEVQAIVMSNEKSGSPLSLEAVTPASKASSKSEATAAL